MVRKYSSDDWYNGPTKVHYVLLYGHRFIRIVLVCIQPSVNDKCLGCFFGLCRKLVRTKTQQSRDKVSKHNRRTVFSRALVLLTRASTGVVSTSFYHVYLLFITLPHNLRQLPFLSLPPQPTECAATIRDPDPDRPDPDPDFPDRYLPFASFITANEFLSPPPWISRKQTLDR